MTVTATVTPVTPADGSFSVDGAAAWAAGMSGTVSGLGTLATQNSVTSSQISDATATGTSVITATDAAAARTAIGAGTGSGTVTSVTGTSPLASSGGATPAISLNDAGVTYAKIQNVSATDKVLGRSSAGAGSIEEISCTAAGRALIDDADAAAQRTTLGLGTLATQSGTFSGTSSGTNTGDQTITLTGNVTGSGTGSFATTIAAGVVTRAMLEATGKNWQFLGQATASGAVRTGTITWTGTYKQLVFQYFIAGYSGSAIGRLIVGPTAGLSETGTTFCTSLIEGVTITATSVSVPGWPLAVTAGAVPRYGWIYVSNVATTVKRMTGHGQHSGTAPTVVPTQMRMEGMFNDTTNLINKAELAVYAAITGATISTTTFNAGTFLNVWGRNDD